MHFSVIFKSLLVRTILNFKITEFFILMVPIKSKIKQKALLPYCFKTTVKIIQTEHLQQLISELLSLGLCCLQGQGPLTTLVLLEFLRWLCRSLVAPSWNVFGKAPSNMVNSGVFNSKREIRTICAAWKEEEKRDHQFLFFEKSMHSLGSDPYSKWCVFNSKRRILYQTNLWNVLCDIS